MKEKTKDIFSGFSADSVGFFRELEANNNKQWFEANRSRYNELHASFTDLILSLNDAMLSIDPDLEVNPRKCISRIYRDMRFSRDRTPYRTCMWFSYKRPVADMNEKPVFFFELSADIYRYGMGFYAATRSALDSYRSGITKDPSGFSAMVRSVEKKGFSPLGDTYKKRIENSLPDNLQELYHKKNLYLMKTCAVDDLIFSPGIVKKLSSDFKTLSAFYKFLWDTQQ